MSFWETLLAFFLIDELFDCDDDYLSQSQNCDNFDEYDEYDDFDEEEDFEEDYLDDDF